MKGFLDHENPYRRLSQQSSIYQFLICTKSARIGETSIHSFIFIQILVIDLDLTIPNESGRWFIQILVIDLDLTIPNESGRWTVCRFGISIQYSFDILLERVTERG